MKRVLKLVFSTALLSALAICQIPQPGACQMMVGGLLAKSCSMPCCKTKMPMPQCPMLKASTPRDIITSSVPTFDETLQPLHAMGLSVLPTSNRITGIVTGFVESLRILFSAPLPSTRAPPPDIHLLNA